MALQNFSVLYKKTDKKTGSTMCSTDTVKANSQAEANRIVRERVEKAGYHFQLR